MHISNIDLHDLYEFGTILVNPFNLNTILI